MPSLQVLGTDKALRIGDYPIMNLVSSVDWTPVFNAEDVNELGTTTKIDTTFELETNGSMELSAIGNTAGLLARMIVRRDASGNFLGYFYDSGSASGRNGYTWTQNDLAEIRFDVLIHEKTEQKDFNRTLILPHCYLTTFSGRADANGRATETYNFAGTFAVGLQKPYHDARAIPARRATATTCNLVNVNALGQPNLTTVTNTTHTLAYLVIEGGRVLTSKATDPTYATLGAAGLVTITTTEGYQLPAGAHITAVVYQTTGSTTFPTAALTSAARFSQSGNRLINYVRGYMANIYLSPVTPGSPVAADQWLRVQTIDWNVDMRVETLRQIALNTQGTAIYSRTCTFPFDVTLNATVIETDWADWKSIMTKSFPGTGPAVDNSYDFAPANLENAFELWIRYYTKDGTLIQTWLFGDARIDGYSTRAQVGGRGEVSWTLKATQFTITGINP